VKLVLAQRPAEPEQPSQLAARAARPVAVPPEVPLREPALLAAPEAVPFSEVRAVPVAQLLPAEGRPLELEASFPAVQVAVVAVPAEARLAVAPKAVR